MSWITQIESLYRSARELPDSTIDPRGAGAWFTGTITEQAAAAYLSEMGVTGRVKVETLSFFGDTLRLKVVASDHAAAFISGREQSVELPA